jgi:tetratricopeptide (TPR) repeat protein
MNYLLWHATFGRVHSFNSRGRWKEALALAARAADVPQGGRHHDSLASMHVLAMTLRQSGRLGEAEALGRQVLETRKRVLRHEHPDTLTSTDELAFTLRSRGKYAKALAMMRACYELPKEQLGIDGFYTTIALNTLKHGRRMGIERRLGPKNRPTQQRRVRGPRRGGKRG